MELSWRKAMEERERTEKNVIMKEREMQTFFLGLEIGMECIKKGIINEINQNISINDDFFFFTIGST